MSSVGVEISLILVLILINGLLAMSEIAVVSSRKARLQQRAEEGDVAAESALRLANNPGDFLSAVQVGITLIGILAGAFGGATLAENLARSMETLTWLAPYRESAALAIVVAMITFLSLVFGELVPKRLALNNPEKIASSIARPMRLLTLVTLPLVRILSGATNAILRILRAKPSGEPPITEAEIMVMLSQGTEAGVIKEVEERLVTNVFRMSDLRASSIMKPRTEIDWLDLGGSPDELYRKITNSTYSRLPVARGGVDDVVGVVQAKDLLGQCMSGQPVDVQTALHEALFIPESNTALQVLEAFKRTGETMGLVIDEYGGVQGLVTVTDVLEAVVGDLGLMGEPGQPKAVRRSDGSWLVDCLMSIEEFNGRFGLADLPGEEDVDYRTVGGLVMEQLGRIPSVADHFEFRGFRFEVMDMDGRRVDKVLVTPQGAST